MAITREHVEYIAHLSRLHVTDDEKATLARQLDSILHYMEKLNELDTSGVEPLVHAAGKTNVFREDAAGQSLPRSESLANAPEQSQGCFKVPRIID